MKHALPSAFSEAASTTSVVVGGVAAAVVEGVVAETRAPVVSSARRFAAFTSDSLFTLCAATRPRTGAAGAAVTGTSLRVSASSFALTSLVNAFRSWRYALRSRELSRICCWMFSDMAAWRGGETGGEEGGRRERARRAPSLAAANNGGDRGVDERNVVERRPEGRVFEGTSEPNPRVQVR